MGASWGRCRTRTGYGAYPGPCREYSSGHSSIIKGPYEHRVEEGEVDVESSCDWRIYSRSGPVHTCKASASNLVHTVKFVKQAQAPAEEKGNFSIPCACFTCEPDFWFVGAHQGGALAWHRGTTRRPTPQKISQSAELYSHIYRSPHVDQNTGTDSCLHFENIAHICCQFLSFWVLLSCHLNMFIESDSRIPVSIYSFGAQRFCYRLVNNLHVTDHQNPIEPDTHQH